MANTMIAEPERAAGLPHPMSLVGGPMVTAGGKILAAPLTPTLPAVAVQPAAPLQAFGCHLGVHGYPRIPSSQQLFSVILPPWSPASTGAGSETYRSVASGAADARNGTSSVPLRAVAVPADPQEVVGTARLKTRDSLEEAAEIAALKAISARRDAQMQQLEAELRRKDAAVKARDEQIALLRWRCEELQRRARCSGPFETERVQPCLEVVNLADDGPGQAAAEMKPPRTPRPLHGLSREDTGVPETCLPGHSRLVSPPSTSCSIAWSELEDEPLCGSVAQAGTADAVDVKVREYLARFPDFGMPVERLKPGSYYLGAPVCEAVSVQLTRGGKAVLKVCGKFRGLDSFLDEVRGASRPASSLSPLASARRGEDHLRRSSSVGRAGASQRARSRA